MASVSIVNYAGRMFDWPVEPNKDGLLALINYTGGGVSMGTSKKLPGVAQAYSARFNPTGDKFVVSDNWGSLIVYHLSANRYSCILRESTPSHCIAFNSYDQVILGQHTQISIHSMNGKVEAEMKGHKTPILRFEMNTRHNLMLSQS